MADDEPVPRLPRSSAFRLSGPALVRIGLTAALLIVLIVAQRPCADAVSRFVTGFGGSAEGSAAASMPRPGTVEQPAGQAGAAGQARPGNPDDYVRLRPDMTEAEIKAAIDEAKAKAAQRAAARAGSGSAGVGSGSADSARSAGGAGSSAGSGSSVQ